MYLSSFRLGDRPELLVALLDVPIGPAAIIPNACDGYPPGGRPGHPETEAVGRAVERFRAAGLPHRTLHDGQAIVIDGPVSAVV